MLKKPQSLKYPLIEVNYIKEQYLKLLEHNQGFVCLVLASYSLDMMTKQGNLISPWYDYTKYFLGNAQIARPNPNLMFKLIGNNLDMQEAIDGKILGFINFLGEYTWAKLDDVMVDKLLKLSEQLYSKEITTRQLGELVAQIKLFDYLVFTSPIIYEQHQSNYT